MENTAQHQWEFCSLGGVVRVNVKSGEDLAHLGELDQKLWTVLSCPAEGLDIDPKTLKILDTDNDGKIHVKEVVAASEWLTSVIKNKDSILDGSSVLQLSQINSADPEGQKLLDSAKRILSNLGLEKKSIAIEDTSDSVAIFAKTKFNGDGIITEASTDDEELKSVIRNIVELTGSFMDRSGAAGVTADNIEAFYQALGEYSAWQAAAEADKANVLPYGDDTAAALAACEAIKDKMDDFFMRCKVIGYNADAAAAVDVSVDKIGEISAGNLATEVSKLAVCPLARPSKAAVLAFDAVNPAWAGAFAAFKSCVLDRELPGATSINEAQWIKVTSKFAPYKQWTGEKKGAAVESLGIGTVNAILASARKPDLIALVEQDKEYADEANGIDNVDKLMHLYRDFYKFVNNYVSFSEFYGRTEDCGAMFEAGKLFIDRRCCNLCIKVSDMGKHADMASLSGMFLIYCSCSSKVRPETFDVLAVMTAGDIKNIRQGTNGVFYDKQGNDWDAVVTRIVDNPISIRQAFWSPYRKVASFISDKIDSFASSRNDAAANLLQSKVDNAAQAPAQETGGQPFDIAKFSGIFAAISLAVSGLVLAISKLADTLKGLAWWQWLVLIAAIMLIISAPACFIAWKQLRKRNLGPVLNANGWAINSVVLVNILFGQTLTKMAKYPKIAADDPYSTPKWKKCLWSTVAVIVLVFGVMYLTDNLKFMGIHKCCKAKTEVTEEAAAEGTGEAADTVVVEDAVEEVVE